VECAINGLQTFGFGRGKEGATPGSEGEEEEVEHGGAAERRRSVARWWHREEQDEAEAPGAGRLHSRKTDAAPGIGGAQAGWAGKGGEEAQRGKRGAGRW
jgi:hypothetical protein